MQTLYVSSSGLGAFITGAKTLGSAGSIVFTALNQHVNQIFEMSGLSNVFQICGTKEAALKKLRSA